MNRTQSLSRLLTLGAMSWFILWACAPTMSVPPATPMTAQTSSEHGLSGQVMSSPLVSQLGFSGTMFSGIVSWGRYAMQSDGMEAGYLISGSYPGLLAAGGYMRLPLKDHAGRFKLQAQAEAGSIWLGGGLPMSFELNDNFHLTANPTVRMGLGNAIAQSIFDHWNEPPATAFAFIPVGAAFRVGQAQLHANAGVFVYGPQMIIGYMGGGMATVSISYAFMGR